MSALLKAAMGVGAEDKLYVDDVFSTYLYAGNSSTQTITNGIDLAGKGGMVWFKPRNATNTHAIRDSSRGAYSLDTTTVNAQGLLSGVTFTSTGFDLNTANYSVNNVANIYASWTFRKAPKFFDVVTWTGDGVAGRTVAHSLGVTPGMIVIKETGASGNNWWVHHRSLSFTNESLCLNLTNAIIASTKVSATSASDFTLTNSVGVNDSGSSYVAYLFAHDDSEDGIIQCGSYVGNGALTGPSIDLGWEPQYVMIKPATVVEGWTIYDAMRGMVVNGTSNYVQANTTATETTATNVFPKATGFDIYSTQARVNTSGASYIYLAIRRPNKPPTSGTQVFNPVVYTGTGFDYRLVGTTISPDFVMARQRGDTVLTGMVTASRLTGNGFMLTGVTTAEATDANSFMTPTTGYGNAFSAMNGFGVGNDDIRKLNTNTAAHVAMAFKRAPGFFDEVCYTGTGSATTVAHNLGAVPELMIVKCRSVTGSWRVYHAALGIDSMVQLESTVGAYSGAGSPYWNSSYPTASLFNLGTDAQVNMSDATYVAYLFATKAGISKVGSYTGNGSSQTINCGFTTGARFVLIKRTDSTGDWFVWDTARGISASTDPHLGLNTTTAEITTDDSIDADTSGFVVNQLADTNINVTNATYIFLAIA